GVTHLFAGRAAYLQVGAMLGTIMVANVFFVIIPAHRELVRAKEAGREPDPAANARGKQRSVHNNYFTLPVLFAMLSNHFSFTYGHAHSWAILVCLMAIGAWVRHYFNLRHRGRTLWWIPVTAALALAGIAVWLRPASTAASSAPVPFSAARAIVTQRCAACHSAHPSAAGFSAPPKGIAFDTPQQIQAKAQLILQQAVGQRTMPLGNVTHMTRGDRRDRAPARLRLRELCEQSGAARGQPLRDGRRRQREPAHARPPLPLGGRAGDRLHRALARRSSADASTSTQRAMSSGSLHSSGEWLTPPAPLRTKSIPQRTPPPVSTPASWPAPERSPGAGSPRCSSS